MRAGVLFPWLLIAVVCVGMTLTSALPEKDADESKAVVAAPRVTGQEQFAGKYAVGVVGLLGTEQAGPVLRQTTAQLGGTAAGRVAAGVLAAELMDGKEGVRRLGEVDHPDAAAFGEVLRGEAAPTDDLLTRYGFYARLAGSLKADDSDPARAAVLAEAQRTVLAVFGLLGLAGLGLAVGLVLLVVGLVTMSAGMWTWKRPPPVGDAAVYLQGFAVYLLSLLGIASGLGALEGRTGMFWINLLPPVLATVAGLVYIAARMPDVTPMRADLGIHRGRGVVWEAVCGVGGYLAGLPVIAVGVGVTLLLSQLSGANPAHPITDVIAEHAVWVVILAVVMAPLTEELFFRGALLAHVRSWLGPILSGLLTALVFAAVHPQGWAGIPALAAIGLVLAMIRQWRGSLIGPIVAHAINNGAVTLMLLLAF